MIFGYTHGELAVTGFIFLLIYGAGLLPRAAAFATRAMSDKSAGTSGGNGPAEDGS